MSVLAVFIQQFNFNVLGNEADTNRKLYFGTLQTTSNS
jgi:hypothetical protein